MACTIKDDKSAIAHASNIASPKCGAQFKNLESKPADFGLWKLGIGGLAAMVTIFLAGRAEARYVNLDCAKPTYVTCRDASRFLDLDGLVNSMYTGSPKQFITGRHNGCNRYRNLKTGDYLDRWWYSFLDEGQYYYLDRTQYKLLGGLSYILGHPCYPKLYERRSEQAVGFANKRRTYLPWYDCCWGYLTVCKPISLGNVCTGYIMQKPIDNYVVWHSCFKPGDYIEKFRYSYLDKGRYYILDKIQYKWLGGLAYLLESPSFGNWYTYDRQHVHVSWHSNNSSYTSDFHCSFKDFKKENITVDIHSTPEPASVLLMTLGTTIITLCRRKR